MVLGVIALIFVGPKELPGLLRTIGKYAGILRRHANEFRGHFDQVLKEAELDKLKDDLTGLKSEVEGVARDAYRSAESQANKATQSLEAAASSTSAKSSSGSGPDASNAGSFFDEDLSSEEAKPVMTAREPTQPDAVQTTSTPVEKPPGDTGTQSGRSETAKSGAAES